MKLKTDRPALLEAAKTAARIAPTNHAADILKGVLLEADEATGELWLTATNRESTVRIRADANIAEGGSAVVNARMFAGMLSLMKSAAISLQGDTGTTTINGDRCTYRINHQPASQFPNTGVPENETAGKLTGVCTLARKTTYTVEDHSDSPVMQCVQLVMEGNRVQAAGMNNARITVTKGSASSEGKQEIVVPARALRKLAEMSSDADVYDVGHDDSRVWFIREGFEFTVNKNTTDKFFDTEAFLGRIAPKHAAIVEAAKMKEALDLASVAAAAGNKKKAVTVTLADGKILLDCRNDSGEADIGVDAQVSAPQEEGFDYNAEWLAQTFATITGSAKILVDERGTMVVKSPPAKPENIYLQMPTRKNGKSNADGGEAGRGDTAAAEAAA